MDRYKKYFNKNKLRTFWGWDILKNKHIEPHADFPGSYKKRVYFAQNLKKLLGLSRRAKNPFKELFKKLTLKWPFPSQIWGLCAHNFNFIFRESTLLFLGWIAMSIYCQCTYFQRFPTGKTWYCLEDVMQCKFVFYTHSRVSTDHFPHYWFKKLLRNFWT